MRSPQGELAPLRSPNYAGHASAFISDILYIFDDSDQYWPAMRSPQGELAPLRSPNYAGHASAFISDILYIFDDSDQYWPAMRSPQGEAWWRRRESNPRPKTFRIGIYIHSLNFRFRLLGLLQAGCVKGYPVRCSPIR
ncbi:MAG: hypothetical protein BMS9Abin03_093 [Thermodesulfobacteriota bacterium]|nr:MAG: hypothetical protein BMS9Abin03_093 [Thermodesulfobacteriota bacterium]